MNLGNGILGIFRISDLISCCSGGAGGGQNQHEQKKSCVFKGCVRRLRTIDVVFADIDRFTCLANERSAFREALLIALPTSVREVDCIMLVLCKAFLKEQFAFFLEIRSIY